MIFAVKKGSFSYSDGRKILSNVSFHLEKGSILSILGQNGIGKTTLLKCILGFQKFSSGEIFLNDEQIYKAGRSFWKKVAYVPQAHVQSFPYTVFETVLMGRTAYLNLFEQPKKADEDIAFEAMKICGILDLAQKNCNEISGGELQLVLIARALAGKPEILVMDEPETGLDFKNQSRVLNLMQQLSHENGLTIIFNTHYPRHALEVSSHTLLLQRNGNSIFGSTEEVCTEENLKTTFGIDLSLQSFEIEGKIYHDIIPLKR